MTITATAPMTSATPTTPTAATVARTRILPVIRPSRRRSRPGSAPIGGQPVARSADGPDGGFSEGAVDFVPQPPDVDLDDVGVTLEFLVPHVVEDRLLGDDLTLAPQQELQQRHLPGGQLDRRTSPARPPGGRVEVEVARLQDSGTVVGASAEQRPEPGEEDHRGERLGQVVVRPRIERF